MVRTRTLFAILFKATLVALAATLFAFSEDAPQVQPIGPFGGLNTNISQEAIDATQSPDLLNVDISLAGKSVKKRYGYGEDATLTVSTSATHNLYKFFDSSGNEVRLAFNDNRVNSSVNGGTWSVILTTGTIGATWDCTDYLGSAYCVSSSFDNPIKTDGTTSGTSGVGGTNAVPAGSMISNTGDRLLVGATSANPSRLYYSASGVFTDFTLGTQSSSSSFEDITAPGSKLTHIAYRFGRWLWWKDQSFGYLIGTSQFDLNTVIVSNTIGTLDNTDVFDSGLVYFRGSDNQMYTYDGSVLRRSISTDVTPTLASTNRRKANSWTQTTQSDFSNGAVVYNGPSLGVSTSIVSGSIYPSSITIVDTSTTDFNQGSFNSYIDTSSVSGAITLKTILHDDFSASTNWVLASSSPFYPAAAVISGGKLSPSGTSASLATSAQSVPNDFFVQFTATFDNLGGSFYLGIVDSSNNDRGYFINIPNQSAGSVSIRVSSTTNFNNPNVDLLVSSRAVSQPTGTHTYALARDSSNGQLTFYVDGVSSFTGVSTSYTSFNSVKFGLQANGAISVDEFYLVPRTAPFTSRQFDTAFSSPIYGTFTAGTSNNGAYSFAYRCSSTSYNADTTISTGSVITGCTYKRYLIYSSSISVNSNAANLPQISSVTVIAASTGTFYSAVRNASALTAWNTLGITDSTNGNSSITYFSRSSTTLFTVLSSTPAWVSQTKNATVSASTGTYFQLRADFLITAATETPHLDDFTFNWFEGSASEKMYATYFKNAIWFSVSLGSTTSTNNRIMRYDLLSNLWTVYDIPANGFLTYNNDLYFGSPTAGKVLRFGNGVTSDNGSSINAYWKSKPFFGESPFTDKDLRMASWYIAESSGTTITVTYTMNESTTVARSINLFSSTKNIIQNNWNFPTGSIGTNFNVQFGDTSTNNPWEVFGGMIIYVPKPWQVTP